MHDKVPSRHPYISYVLSLPLKLAWRTKISGLIYAQAVACDKQVYVLSWYKLHALDLETGHQIWEFEPLVDSNKGVPAIWKDRIYFADFSGTVYCLNRQTGKLLWKNDQIRATDEFINIYQDRIFLKTSREDINNGTKMQGYTCLTPDGDLVWFAQSSNLVWTLQAAIVDDILIFGDGDGFVYGVQVQDGQIIWQIDVKPLVEVKSVVRPRPISANGAPKIVGTTVIMHVGTGQNYSAFDVRTGQVKWVYMDDIYGNNEACDEKNFYYTTPKYLRCIDIETGQLLWTADIRKYNISDPRACSGLVVGNYYIASFGEDHKIAAFNIQNGQLEWQYTAGNLFHAGPIFAEGKLVIGCSDSYVYCFEESK